MNILVIDSCGPSCGVCVWQNGRVLARAVEPMERGQDARLMPMIVATLAKARIDFCKLDRVAVTRGPGSFTGVRVGLATARGIGIASGKPVVGIDRFSIYQAMQADPRNALVVIQSKRAELFCQYFPLQGPPHDACMMTREEISNFITEHPGTSMTGDLSATDADILSTCARLAAGADPDSTKHCPSPLYLRAPDVTLPSALGR